MKVTAIDNLIVSYEKDYKSLKNRKDQLNHVKVFTNNANLILRNMEHVIETIEIDDRFVVCIAFKQEDRIVLKAAKF